MFGRKNKQPEPELEQQPLGYWEERSYLLAVTDDPNDFPEVDDIYNRLASIEGLTVKGNSFDKQAGILEYDLSYFGKSYVVQFYPMEYQIPEFMYYTAKDVDREKLSRVRYAFSTIMEFVDEPQKDYHLQLKIVAAVTPDFPAYVDESQEKIIPSKWLMLAAASKLPPAPSTLYTIQCVSSRSPDQFWLHSHGLCRCGFTEVEILDSDREHVNGHFNLLNAFASYMIDNDVDFDYKNDTAYIARLSNGAPVLAKCIIWTQALKEYPPLKLGGVADRQEGHNSLTSPIFLVSHRKNDGGKLMKVNVYDEYWDDNPIYYYSDKETERMSALAVERFDYLKKAAADPRFQILIKIALAADEGAENPREHIWFELLEFEGERFKARLTQEPYNVSNFHEGDEGVFGIEDVTDWTIFSQYGRFSPNEAYLLDDLLEN